MNIFAFFRRKSPAPVAAEPGRDQVLSAAQIAFNRVCEGLLSSAENEPDWWTLTNIESALREGTVRLVHTQRPGLVVTSFIDPRTKQRVAILQTDNSEAAVPHELFDRLYSSVSTRLRDKAYSDAIRLLSLPPTRMP